MIELKSSVVADLCKEVIAFANTRGGTLYIGVEDNGTVIGVDSADRVTLQINNMVRDSIKPDITMFVHLFFVKHFSLKKASEFPVFSKGFSLL